MTAARAAGPPRASVVVPTRDRPQALERCLDALARQDPPPAEVIVVDDGSADAQAITDLVAAVPGGRIVRLSGAGPAAARNAGAVAASGDVICFTDDDCVPAPGWAAALSRAADKAGAAAGTTLTRPDAPAAAKATQAIIDHLQAWAADPASPSPGFAPTCNLGVRAALMREIPFDERYPAAAGEDREWAARAASAGIVPAPAPTAVVVHEIRGGLRAFARRQFRYGRGSARFRAGGRGGAGPLRFYTGLLREGFRRGPGTGALVATAQALGAAGALAAALSRAAGRPQDPRRAPR